ncbi:hypothetical protein [Synechococcus sp. PCC 7336]|uniref:hypothetical protein n=1 Tax=Synechococcus sp. PCC 7336 TaxID=195250 RepID=UPI000345D2BF|nr:hypothetical protein [Synechococcus sp. PCC 7336]
MTPFDVPDIQNTVREWLNSLPDRDAIEKELPSSSRDSFQNRELKYRLELEVCPGVILNCYPLWLVGHNLPVIAEMEFLWPESDRWDDAPELLACPDGKSQFCHTQPENALAWIEAANQLANSFKQNFQKVEAEADQFL